MARRFLFNDDLSVQQLNEYNNPIPFEGVLPDVRFLERERGNSKRKIYVERNKPVEEGINALSGIYKDKAEQVRNKQLKALVKDLAQQQPKRKFAGEIYEDEQFMAELKQLAMEQDAAEEAAELARQYKILEDIHGVSETKAFLDPNNPSQTVEQQIGRDLLFKGQEPAFIPADRILGADVSPRGLGIDGGFKPDSEVRRHAEGIIGEDLDVFRTPVYTEILSPKGIQESMSTWMQNNPRKNQRTRAQFNNSASEYYGQQALKLRGYNPVPDDLRSANTIAHGKNQYGNSRPQDSPYGTDRLIENSSQLSARDIGESADFRAIAPDGQVVVLDNQVGILDDGSVNLNLLKNSNITRENLPEFERQLRAIAKELPAGTDLDTIMGEMINRGYLSPLKTETTKQNTRAGKFLSDGEIMGQMNYRDQHRMQGVLYPLMENNTRSDMYGMLPKEFRFYKSDNVRKHIGDKLQNDKPIDLFTKGTSQSGNLYMSAPISQAGSGFLTENLNRQFGEGYTF